MKWHSTTLRYDVMDFFGLSVPDFQVLDYIARTSNSAYSSNGWCNKSIKEMSDSLRISESTVKRSITFCLEKGILYKNDEIAQLRKVDRNFVIACENYKDLSQFEGLGQNELGKVIGQNELPPPVILTHNLGQNDLPTPILLNKEIDINNNSDSKNFFLRFKNTNHYIYSPHGPFDHSKEKWIIETIAVDKLVIVAQSVFHHYMQQFHPIRWQGACNTYQIGKDYLNSFFQEFAVTEFKNADHLINSLTKIGKRGPIQQVNPTILNAPKSEEPETSEAERLALMREAEQREKALEDQLRRTNPEYFGPDGKKYSQAQINAIRNGKPNPETKSYHFDV